MAPSIQSVDEIRLAFPHPEIPKVEGEPTYATIKALHDLLKSNAASIPTVLGGGGHGHLGLVMAGVLYAAVTGQVFNRPNNPGAAPAVQAGATQAQISVNIIAEVIDKFKKIHLFMIYAGGHDKKVTKLDYLSMFT